MYSSGDSPVGHRKHFYKQGLAVGRNVHEQNEVRKSKREKSFAVKRQQFLLEAAADSPNERASIEALCTFTPLQIAEAVSALQTAAAAVVSARGGSLPVATGSTMDAVWAQWESAKSGMPALSGSSVLGYGMATLGGASSAILGLRRILAIYSPPCAEVIRCGALLPMVALLDVCTELALAHAVDKGHVATIIELCLKDGFFCVGNLLSDEMVTSVQARSLLLSAETIFCDSAAAFLSQRCTTGDVSDATAAVVSNRWSSAGAVSYAVLHLLGNISVDHPDLIVKQEQLQNCVTTGEQQEDAQMLGPTTGTDNSTAPQRDSGSTPTQSSNSNRIIKLCIQILSVAVEELIASHEVVVANSTNNSTSSGTAANALGEGNVGGSERPVTAVDFAKDVGWLFANITRNRSRIYTNLLFNIRTASQEQDQSRIVNDANDSLSVFVPVSKIFSYVTGTTAGTFIASMPVNSKLRQTTGELLWVVAYCISSIANNPEQFDVIFLQQLFQLTPALSNILLQLLQYTSVDHESRPATPQLTSSPNEWTVNSSPSPEAKYAVDLITPILEFLRYAVVLSGPADIFGGVISTADRLVASEDMHLVLNIGLSHSHRGVQRGMCEIAATLAAAAQPHTKYVLLHLQPLAKLLSSTAGCDVKRETATAITHLALNHDGKFFNFVMAVEPRVVDSLMSTLQKCKTDELFVLVALDFLELALNRWPRARWYMYEQGIVEILEDVHPSQGEALYERIAAMLRQHFDDVEIASLDEAREAEFNAELQLSRQILLNEKWSDV
eukprot:Lankesteria_metandrocarpae@DN1166_c0_g1_i1.p1